MRYSSTFSVQAGSCLNAWIGRTGKLATQVVIVTLMAALFPPGAHSESWDDMFKGMARDMIEEGTRAIREGNDRSDQNRRQQQPYEQQPHQPYQQPQQQYQYQQPAQRPAQPSSQYSRAQVMEIQTRLQVLGYNPGPADGLFGNKTAKAISQFEIDQGLPETGRPNQGVIDALQYATSNMARPSSSDRQTQAASPQSYRVSTENTSRFDTQSGYKEDPSRAAYVCMQAHVDCMEHTRNRDMKQLCVQQYSNCLDNPNASLHFNKGTISYNDIMSEARDIVKQCKQGAVASTLYNCDCNGDQYVMYRQHNHGSYNRVVLDFQRSGLMRQCYNIEGAYQYSYNKCKDTLATTIAPGKNAAQKDAFCHCTADRFSKGYSNRTTLDSGALEKELHDALNACI